jgi:hypothetical protein
LDLKAHYSAALAGLILLTVCSVSAFGKDEKPAIGRVILIEGFEKGVGDLNLFAVGQCGITSGSTNRRSDRNAKSGQFAIEQHYVAAPTGLHGCAAHQDVNLNIEFALPKGKSQSGFDVVALKADFYFVTPREGASKAIQRKLIWAKSGDDGRGRSNWEVVLSSEGSPRGKIGLRLGYQDRLRGGHSFGLYGGDVDRGFSTLQPNAHNGIVELDYDRWYTIEMVLARKTPGKQDAKVYLFVDGVLAFQKTSRWNEPENINARTSFPFDDLDPGNFNWFWFGQQADRAVRMSGDEKVIDEYRYIDNITICAGGRCPSGVPFPWNWFLPTF